MDAIQGALSACEHCSDSALVVLNPRPADASPSASTVEGGLEGAAGWVNVEGVTASQAPLVPPYLKAYLGSTPCQKHVLFYVCASEAQEPPGVERVGRVAVIRPGSLGEGHFCIARLVKKDSMPCGWDVEEVTMHRLKDNQ